MPTLIGHAISGIAVSAAAPRQSYWKRVALLCMICAAAPDADAVTFRFGIPYSHWLGHRGFSHSLLFAGVLSSAALLFVRKFEPSVKKRVTVWSCFFVSTALHGILDAMTNGGLGIAFFSPFDMTRYFLPRRPIEVSPISITRFFSYRGSHVLRSEFFWVMLPSLFVAAGLRLLNRTSERLQNK